MTPKPGATPYSRSSMAATYLRAMRCPVLRRRDSDSGFRTELETLVGDAKGKGTSGRTARPKVPMRQPGADCPIVVMKRGNARRAKGVGHPRRELGVNGRPEDLTDLDGRRQPSVGGTSRVTGDSQARFCEGLGVKFLGATRPCARRAWQDGHTPRR